MAWQEQRVVRIWAGRPPAQQALLGSGILVGNGLVLTAHHVVHDKQGPISELWIDNAGHASEATVEGSDASLDVAILALTRAASVGGAPLDILRGRETRAGEPISIQGYPMVSQAQQSLALWTPNGSLQACSETATQLKVEVMAPPADRAGWMGMSGGAVVDTTAGHVLGVVTRIPGGWDGKVVVATPVRRILEEERLREALGISSEDAAHSIAVERLIRELTDELMANEAVDLRARLGLHLGLADTSAPGLARALVRDVSCDAVTNALNTIDEEIRASGSAGTRRRLRCVLKIFLPACVEWKQAALDFRRERAAGKRTFILKVSNATAAEAVCAAADGGAALVVRDPRSRQIPKGERALVNLAGDIEKKFMGSDETVLAALIEALGETLELDRDAHGRFSVEQIKNRMLGLATRGAAAKRRTAYFLFRPSEVKEPEWFWEVVQRVASANFEHLWMIRLDSNFRAIDDNIARDFVEIMKRADEDHLEP